MIPLLRRTAHDTQHGFTLIEVMVAIFILAIGILAAATMQTTSLKGNYHAKQLSLAVIQGAGQLDTLMGKQFTASATETQLTTLQLYQKKATYAEAVAGLDYTDEAGKSADYTTTDIQTSGASTTTNTPVDAKLTIFWNIADNYPMYGCKTIRIIVRRSDHSSTKETSMDFIRLLPI